MEVPASQAAVAVVEFSSTALVRVDGDVDLATVHELTAALQRVDLRTITLLVLDIDEIGFLDLAGLNAILSLNDDCTINDVHLSVIAPRGPAKRLFTLTHTDLELDLVDAGVHADR